MYQKEKMKYILLVGMGGGIGAVLRYGIGLLSLDNATLRLGMGTLVSNLLGCFLFGLIYALSIKTGYVSEDSKKFLLVGLCGGLTTFSSFIFDLMRYFEMQDYGRGSLYFLLNILLGVAVFIIAGSLVRLIQSG